MTLLRPRRLLPLLLLLYITVDFMDPSVPGVFFFDNDALFVDGVVQVKAHASRDLTPIEPIRSGAKADCTYDTSAAKLRNTAQSLRLQHTRWRSFRHDDSVSFDSSSPSDSSPIPPLS